MIPACPHCEKKPHYIYDSRTIVRFGSFYRTSDSKSVKRFRCTGCKRTFSKATRDPFFKLKKRQKNLTIFELLASGVTQRRTARLTRITRKTVARRLRLFGRLGREKLFFDNSCLEVSEMQFDDLETFENSKCQPVAVSLAVAHPQRRFLGFRVAQMTAKGRLKSKSIKRYGFRKDERRKMRRELFSELKPLLKKGAVIRTDSNPYYVRDIRDYFPDCTHVQIKGVRGAVTGQGELKKTAFDPIFSLNHTCAMLRANISRLIRKTWATTKRKERLLDHLAIYAVYHNAHL